jgi:hypothetical protein
MATRKCFACGRKLGKNPYRAVCEDEQIVFIGSECFKLIGPDGFQLDHGPRLYRGIFAPNGVLLQVIGLDSHPSIGKQY